MIIPPVPQIVPRDRLPVLEPMNLIGDRNYAGDREGLAQVHHGVAVVDGRRLLELCGLLAQVIGCSHNKKRTLV